MAKLSPNNHLSGSVLPAWLGYSPYQSPYEVLEVARSDEQPELDSLQADIGTAVEPVILSRGLRMLGIDPATMRNHQEGGQLAAKKHGSLELYYSDDGLVDIEQPLKIHASEGEGIHIMSGDAEITLQGTVVLEAKYTTAAEKPSDPPLFRGPLQLQGGMMCHSADYGILFTCYAGRKIVVHIFERHLATQETITDGVVKFEQHMAAGTWPDPVTTDDMAKYFDEPKEEPIELGDDLVDCVLSIEDANQAVKQQQELKEVNGQRLMLAMGNHTKASVVDSRSGVAYSVSWPFRKTKAKPAECCPACNHEIKAAVPESETRQKTVTVRRTK